VEQVILLALLSLIPLPKASVSGGLRLDTFSVYFLELLCDEIFGMYFAELISPDDLLQACTLWEKLDV